MFTGIVETLGKVIRISEEGTNKHFFIASNFAHELKIDQSVSHNGVCLTIVSVEGDTHQVTAIDETLKKTNLNAWRVGDFVNLERGMKLSDRLDGHIVQGHIDQTAECVRIEDHNGSKTFTFNYLPKGNITIEKGSVTINGVSLTVINSRKGTFSVAIIPYTMAHTTFQYLKEGDCVNVEFDVIGKYILANIAQNS